jgi:hypothetical protein
MARLQTDALVYMPIQFDIFTDFKLIYAKELVDPGGQNFNLRFQVGALLIHFYAAIYKNGYYLKYEFPQAVGLAHSVGDGINNTILNIVLDAYLNAGLFDKELYEKYNILTSHGVQKQWLKIVIKSRRKNHTILKQYNLLTEEEAAEIKKSTKKVVKKTPDGRFTTAEIPINADINSDKRAKNEITTDTGTQKKFIINNKGIDNKSNSNNYLDNTLINSNKEFTTAEIPINADINSDKRAKNEITTDITTAEMNYEQQNGDFMPEEIPIDVTLKRIKVNIPLNSYSAFPIEICAENYFSPQYSITMERVAHNNHLTPTQLKEWISAFNRMLIESAVYERTMNGTNGYAQHFANWLKGFMGKNQDPNLLNTVNQPKLKNDGKPNTTAKTGKEKIGGIPSEEVRRFFNGDV